MKVSDIMKKDVYTVSPEDPLDKIATLMCEHKISGIPVINPQGKIVGIVSEKDILKAMYPTYDEFFEDPLSSMDFERMEERYKDVRTQPIKQIMTSKVVTVPPDTPILKAASEMILKRIRRIPVVDNGKLVGIISQGDVHQAIFRTYCK